MTTRRAISMTVALLILCTIDSIALDDDTTRVEMPLVVEVRNRLYPDFYEIHHTRLNERVYIGDTEFSFKVVEFYPHFAIVEVDSTKTIKSLSDEPKNVAFKIEVYEDEAMVRTAWAFYTLEVPHFMRDEYLTFDVVEFEYRGELFSKRTMEGTY